MRWKYRRRIKILPGVRLNVTKDGISSVSCGGNGITINKSDKRGTTLTTSIRGTGLSRTLRLAAPDRNHKSDRTPIPGKEVWELLALLVVAIGLMLVFLPIH